MVDRRKSLWKSKTHPETRNRHRDSDRLPLTGWGAACQEDKASGSWSHEEKQQHINFLQLKSAFLEIKLYAKPGTHVLIQTDNRTELRFLNKYRGIHSLTLCNFAIEILTYTMQRQFLVTEEYIPGKENNTTDILSRLVDRDESNGAYIT